MTRRDDFEHAEIDPHGDKNTSSVHTEENLQTHNLGTVEKRRKSSGLMKIVFIIVALIVILVAGFKIFLSFKPKDEDKKTKGDDTVQTTNKTRNDLGTDFAPPSDPVTEKTTDPVGGTAASAPPPQVENGGFRKYLSIPSEGNGSSRNNAAPSGSGQSANSKASVQPVKASAEAKSAPVGMQVEKIKMDPNLYIEANTFIPCTLQTRFVSDVAGRVNCIISTDVWSANGRVKLLEKGTKAFGHYQTGSLKHGQGRMFVIWDQLRTPDFMKITLSDTQATGDLGENGVAGYIDTHFWERFGNAMLLSTVQDGLASLSGQAISKDSNSDYTANSREAFAQMAKTTLENSINIPPTMYLNQGDTIGMLTGDDIDFSGVYKLKAQ